MADSALSVVVASVGETKFDGPAVSITVPSTGGELTLLAHHEPIITTLQKGTLKVRSIAAGKEDLVLDIEGGVLECAHNRVVVLL